MRGCSTGNRGQGLTAMCDSVAKESEYLGVRPLLGQLVPNTNANPNANTNANANTNTNANANTNTKKNSIEP